MPAIRTYDPRMHEWLQRSIRHESSLRLWFMNGTVVANTLDLQPTNMDLTFNETRLPMVVLNVTVPIPSDAVLALLDPRLGNVRGLPAAGYVYPTGKTESFYQANLLLRERVLDRPSNTLRMTFMDDLSVLQDQSSVPTTTFTNSDYNRGLFPQILGTVFGTNGTNYFLNGNTGFSFGAPRTIVTNDLLGSLKQLADEDKLEFGCEGTYSGTSPTFYVYPASFITEAMLDLRTGAVGTVTEATTQLSRAGSDAAGPWANDVVLEYTWTDTDTARTQRIITARARATDGPYAATGKNIKRWFEKRTGPVTQAQADNAAAAQLNRMFNRGRTLKVSAVAAYWLRPRDTVNVLLPTGGQEQHLVTAVTFDYTTGLMTVDTKLPPSATTISTGA